MLFKFVLLYIIAVTSYFSFCLAHILQAREKMSIINATVGPRVPRYYCACFLLAYNRIFFSKIDCLRIKFIRRIPASYYETCVSLPRVTRNSWRLERESTRVTLLVTDRTCDISWLGTFSFPYKTCFVFRLVRNQARSSVACTSRRHFYRQPQLFVHVTVFVVMTANTWYSIWQYRISSLWLKMSGIEFTKKNRME